MNFLKDYLQDHIGFIPIISVTESWCKKYHSDAQINLPNFKVYRADIGCLLLEADVLFMFVIILLLRMLNVLTINSVK